MYFYKEFKELENMFPFSNKSNAHISEKGVEWHLDHALKVIIKVCEALIKSDPSDYKWSFNLSKMYVLTTKKIPRGKTKAPPSVITTNVITKDDLRIQLKSAKLGMNEILKLTQKHNFKHPTLGYLDLVESKKFIKIHTMHHLKIMHDIIKE